MVVVLLRCTERSVPSMRIVPPQKPCLQGTTQGRPIVETAKKSLIRVREMPAKANVYEVFDSIQGEGPYVGTRQVFVRFQGCPLTCVYCDSTSAKLLESAHQVTSNAMRCLKEPSFSEGSHKTRRKPVQSFDRIPQPDRRRTTVTHRFCFRACR